jgi:glycosyltransferase involved in cell wall biosynthesis
MKLSVIVPFFNEIEFIERAVNSIFLQDFDSNCVEVIICNDGPLSDCEILARIDGALHFAIRVIKNQFMKGPGGARNSGLDVCTGDLIAFLDADDFWLPGKIIEQRLEISHGATFVATAYRFDTGATVVLPPITIRKPVDVFLCRGIGTSTVIITRTLLADLRFKDLRFAQDIDFWYALASSPHFRYAAVHACFVEYSTGGSTKNKWVQLQYLHKVLRINNVSWLHHVRVLTSYVLAGVYNHYIKRLFT